MNVKAVSLSVYEAHPINSISLKPTLQLKLRLECGAFKHDLDTMIVVEVGWKPQNNVR